MHLLWNLEELSLASNRLSGPLPTGLGQCARMRLLSLRGNRLNGAVPASLARCQLLEHLDLGRNKLSGALPAALAQLKSLRALYLDNNDFEFAPRELERCSLLRQLSLEDNPRLQMDLLPAGLTRVLVSSAAAAPAVAVPMGDGRSSQPQPAGARRDLLGLLDGARTHGAKLRAALPTNGSRGPTTVLVTGGPSVGKSTLVEQLRQRLDCTVVPEATMQA